MKQLTPFFFLCSLAVCEGASAQNTVEVRFDGLVQSTTGTFAGSPFANVGVGDQVEYFFEVSLPGTAPNASARFYSVVDGSAHFRIGVSTLSGVPSGSQLLLFDGTALTDLIRIESSLGAGLEAEINLADNSAMLLQGPEIEQNLGEYLPGDFSDVQFEVTAPAGSIVLEFTQASLSAIDKGIGATYCSSQPNSVSALGARIAAQGSTSLASQELILLARNVPSQPGIFFFGPRQLDIPFGNGRRCVGGTVTRLPVVVATAGTLEYSFEFDAFGGLLLPTTHFQAWYRDPAAGGAAFNLSDGLTISFLP